MPNEKSVLATEVAVAPAPWSEPSPVAAYFEDSDLSPRSGLARTDATVTPRQSLFTEGARSETAELVLHSTELGAHAKTWSIPWFPVSPRRHPASRSLAFEEAQHWQGQVLEVTADGVFAKLSRRFDDFPSEEAFIPWAEIADSDIPLAVPGALFHLRVGYLKIDHQKLSVSKVTFERNSGFSESAQAEAAHRATEFAELFSNADGND